MRVAPAKRDENGNVLTVPVTPEVQEVINAWSEKHGEDLNAQLERFGLGSYNIVRPEYRRVVLEGEDISEAIDVLMATGVALTEQDAADIAATAVQAFALVASARVVKVLGGGAK